MGAEGAARRRVAPRRRVHPGAPASISSARVHDMTQDVTVVILAGGKGTRLAPYTTVLPKPLMPVGEMPILEIVIRQLQYYGFRNIVISVGHLAELISTFFGDGSKWQMNIR